ncbi:TIP41-domain-containing protein [Annulohypoxylon maeteangense]|uniref:TIP41-domain-containing protein n=1 Tax=Annulohypoxylon maeteangense TaxID=1927788 RepID=UPI00200892E7|nr:TIP41-domain-containing protein [Annulohypoxylon maeteangense]KAI0883630.1 TIP41-domain-containing protein [Annulohypoxylon maeteangense]
MAAHITSPNEPFPRPEHIAQATTSHRQGNFVISSRKLPISKAGPIDAMERSLGIPVPEMIFGDNVVAIRHAPTGWGIEFNAYDALDAVDKTDRHMLQVAYAKSWSASREQTSAGIKDVVKPYDWSYSTTYKGTIISGIASKFPPPPPPPGSSIDAHTTTAVAKTTAPAPAPSDPAINESASSEATQEKEPESQSKLSFIPSTKPIPLELLKRRDPILFFDEVMLYESELDDNGISVLSVKVRVHEQRMLLLARLFMRLDNVLMRIRDTRVYVDFAAEEVTREYTIKEAGFGDVKRKLLMTGLVPDAITVAMRDANTIADLLPTVEQTLERVSLKS